MDFGLAKRLAEKGCNIVSGLAVVIDAAAHRGALVAQRRHYQRSTGCGVWQPLSKTKYSTHLATFGRRRYLVYEYSAEVAPRPHHFSE